jgi:hypothetical protein
METQPMLSPQSDHDAHATIDIDLDASTSHDESAPMLTTAAAADDSTRDFTHRPSLQHDELSPILMSPPPSIDAASASTAANERPSVASSSATIASRSASPVVPHKIISSSDGVFANLSAKPTLAATSTENINVNEPPGYHEVADDQAPPVRSLC